MSETDLLALNSLVLWSAFGLALAFGAIAQRTQFCTMGAIADVITMGDWSRARMWAGAVGTAAIGFAALSGAGMIDPAASLYAMPRLTWLSYLVGGLMFGTGMVLASGCGAKTLVRIGGGNLKSLVVFVVLGVSAFATLRGITAVWRVATLDTVLLQLPVGQDLPALVAQSAGPARRAIGLWLGLGLGVAVWGWVLSRREGRDPRVLGAALGIGGVVAAMWWVSGSLGHVAEHPLTLEQAYLGSNSRGMEALSFVAPAAYTLDWLMLFSDKSKALTFGVVTPLGVVLGSALVALWTRRFRWEGFGGPEDLANHLAGAVLMGVGGVTAMGCTIGQGLSGLSTLALGSFIALAGIVMGAVLALRYQTWRLEQLV